MKKKQEFSFNAKILITLGESEVESNQVTVKNNRTRQEVTASLTQLIEDFQTVFKELGF